jgi:diguanylate cyclase (GGDEF)-like protein/PAS domain S-box-containing protein
MKLHDLRLSTRIAAAALLTVAAAALATLFIEETRLRQVYLSERRASLEEAAHGESVRLTQAIDRLRQDVLFLSNTPPVSGILRAVQNNGYDPRDGDTRERWEQRMRQIFVAFSNAHPGYYRIHYTGVADGGRDLVRIERRGGKVDASPALRSASGSEYFGAVLKLRRGQVHFSSFEPERETGADQSRLAVHAATPVFDENGKVFGMVAVDMDVAELLKHATLGLPPGVQTFIANRDGHYLLHSGAPHSTAGRENEILRDFPALSTLFDPGAPPYFPLQAANTGEMRGHLAAERIHFDSADPARFLLLAYLIPAEVAAQQVASIPMQQIVGGFSAMLLLAGIVLLLLRRTFAPLGQLAVAADRIASGEHLIHLPKSDGGEIGRLLKAFEAMQERLAQREREILRINAGLEQQVAERTAQLEQANEHLREEIRMREQAVEVIRREHDFREEMIESLPGIFYMIDTTGHFLMWNDNIERVLKCSAEEITRSHALDFFEGEDRALIESGISKTFEQGEAAADAVLVAKDGTRTPYHFTGRRIARDGEAVLVGLGIDIAERQRIQRETEALLRRNEALMQTSMDGIHVMDMEGNLVAANDAFCRMLGYSSEEASGLNVADWDSQWSVAELREKFRELIGKSEMFETVHRRKDGTLINVEISAAGVELDGRQYVYASSRDITERKRTDAMLRQHKAVIDTAREGFWMVDRQGYLQEVNEAYARMSGYPAEELVGMHISQLEAGDVQAQRDKTTMQGTSRFESRHRRKNGEEFDVEVSMTYMPESQQFFAFCHDISRRKRAEQELRIAATAFETHDAIMITDVNANIIRVNQAFTDITGYPAHEVLGKNPRMLSSGRQDKQFYVEMWDQLLRTGSWAGELWDRRKNGQVYPKWLTISAVKDERGQTTHYVGIFSDITARKQAEEEIRNLAFYDALTKLPNRRLFLDRFRAALPASARHRNYGAVLFIDMDKFKQLNDTLGHDYGDLMLIEVARRTKACVREMDTVARLGGDEFVVLIEEVSRDAEDASHKVGLVAEKIRAALAQPYLLREHEHRSSPSIGVSLYRGNEHPVEELLRHADMAMYRAKEAGRNAVRFFDPVMQENVVAHAALERDLHKAVELEQLQLYYQVQVDRDRRPIGAEALLRWIHPQRGVIEPEDFLSVAEENTLILDIDRWVLEAACRQLSRWGKEERQGLTLAVNVSAKTFFMPDFVEKFAAILEAHQVASSRLIVELTESMVLADMAGTVARMLKLRELGVRLSMDDFGAKYSSLSYLKQLPLDQLKIAQEFVRGIEKNGNDAMLTAAIIDLARGFHLHVIAEGVENEAQFAFLEQHECMAYQGYLFGRPVAPEKFEALLERM